MRIGVIGCGKMGERHIEAAQILHKVVGVADKDEAVLAEVGQRHSLSKAVLFTDSVEMLGRTQPDIVVIATTAPSHAFLVEQAVRHGASHILCEKPMATSVADGERMIALARNAGVKLAINHLRRVLPVMEAIRGVLDRPQFDGLVSMSVAAGNFGLTMNGVHYIEMFLALTGSAPAGVSAWFDEERGGNPRGPEFIEWAGSMRLRTEGAQRLYIDAGSDQGHGFKAQIMGRCGHALLDEAAGRITVDMRTIERLNEPSTRYGGPREIDVVEIGPADLVKGCANMLETLIGDGDYPTGEQALETIRVLAAAYLSNQARGREFTMAELGDARDLRFDFA